MVMHVGEGLDRLSPDRGCKRIICSIFLWNRILFLHRKSGPLDQSKISAEVQQEVRAYMTLPWSFVSENTNSKHQITNKSQIPIFNDQNLPRQDIVWIFEFWSLEFVWYLCFDIWDFNIWMKFQQSKSPQGITKAWSSGSGFLMFLWKGNKKTWHNLKKQDQALLRRRWNQ